jgi:hypothetical protein
MVSHLVPKKAPAGQTMFATAGFPRSCLFEPNLPAKVSLGISIYFSVETSLQYRLHPSAPASYITLHGPYFSSRTFVYLVV